MSRVIALGAVAVAMYVDMRSSVPSVIRRYIEIQRKRTDSAAETSCGRNDATCRQRCAPSHL